MKIENIKVYNFEGAFRGLRNPKDSWEKSDSSFGLLAVEDLKNEDVILDMDGDICSYAHIGPKDMDLAKRLIKAGPEHRKFMRQIIVSFDLTAPLYMWKEFDTYKVGTVANSCSTMHTITNHPITLDCFEIGDFQNIEYPEEEQREDAKGYADPMFIQEHLIPYLEYLRTKYIETKDVVYWKELIRWLPESWLQKRTITMSYENIYNIIHQREHHKLTEWHYFVDKLKQLPYMGDFLEDNKPATEDNSNKIKIILDKIKAILENN